MSKELPYFKFYTSEWNDGDITLEDYETQGVFINICSLYWSRGCDLTKKTLNKRFRNNLENILILTKEGFLVIDDDDLVSIRFLDELANKKDRRSSTSKVNGAKGGRPKKPNKPIDNPEEPNSEPNKTQYREEERREEERREEVKKKQKEAFKNSFEIFWADYPKKINKPKAETTLIKYLKSGITIEKICEAMNKSEALRRDREYIPNPQAWLNAEPWNDEEFKPIESALSLSDKIEQRKREQ